MGGTHIATNPPHVPHTFWIRNEAQKHKMSNRNMQDIRLAVRQKCELGKMIDRWPPSYCKVGGLQGIAF